MTSRSSTVTPPKNARVRRPDMYPRMYSTLTTTSGRGGPARSPAKPRSKNAAPVSIEVERRSALVAANHAIQDVLNFRAAYRMDGIDVTKCKKTVAYLLHRHGEATNDPGADDGEYSDDEQPTIKMKATTFCDLLASGKIELQQRRSVELDQLALICVHQRAADEIFATSWTRLRDVAQSHVARFCVSFAADLTGVEEVKCVQGYEGEIRQFGDAIAEKTTKLDELLSSYSAMKQLDMDAYLDSRHKIAEVVDEACGIITDVAELVCRWVHSDKAYPGKLWDAIISENVERGKLREDVKRLTRKHETLAHSVARRQLVWDKTNAQLDDKKVERRRTRDGRETVEKKTAKQAKEMEAKQKALEENETKIHNRKSNSPRYLEMLWKNSETIQGNIEKLKQSSEFHAKHLSRLTKEEQLHANEARLLEKELDVLDTAIRSMRHKITDLDAEIDSTNAAVRAKEGKIAAAKKIRELKLSSMTLRNIYFQKMDTSKRDNLTRACRLVARRIGKAWCDLYMELPFIPVRDQDRRRHDLDVLDMAAVHGDRPVREQAWHGLLKWRLFSHRGNVSQLVHSLKLIERRDLAYGVQQLYMKATA